MADAASALLGANFDDLFTREIEPELRAREGGRQEAVQTFALSLFAGVLLVVVEGLLTRLLTQGRAYTPPILFAIVTVAVAGYVGYLPLQRVTRAAKADIISALCKPLGITFRERGFAPPDPVSFQNLRLLPRFDSSAYEDQFSGTRNGHAFELCEATLIMGSGKNRRTVFRGQVFKISLLKPFDGTTVVLRDGGWLNHFEAPTGLQRVGLEDPKFETIFEAYGSDQVGAREVLTPAFMDQIQALESSFTGARLRFAFDSGAVMIAMEGGNRFEIGSPFSTLIDRRRVEGVARDLASVFKLIDSFAA